MKFNEKEYFYGKVESQGEKWICFEALDSGSVESKNLWDGWKEWMCKKVGETEGDEEDNKLNKVKLQLLKNKK